MAFCAYCGTQVPGVSFARCASCGNPTNGAPRPTASSNPVPVVLIVVIVLFVGIGMAGIVAAIAIPNFLTAMQRSKQKRSMADVRTIAAAVEAYATDNNRYPEAAGVSELNTHLVPKYLQVVPTVDGWGHPFRYQAWSSGGRTADSYAVGSAGKDGQFEHDSLRDYADPGATTNFNNDLIFSNGSFVRYPEGVQVQ